MRSLSIFQSRLLSSAYRHLNKTSQNGCTFRCFSFSFAGPRQLDDILKKDMIKDKTATEVADIWYTYHESKDNIHGLVLGGEQAKSILSRAALSPYFVQPIFRDDGFFMMVSQFQSPNHFLMAYLEDFKMDPSRAQPLLTFSIFDDYASDKDLTLIRADVLNKGILDAEGLKVVGNMLDMYLEDDEYMTVHAFNKNPDTFDFDEFVKKQNKKWEGERTNNDDEDKKE